MVLHKRTLSRPRRAFKSNFFLAIMIQVSIQISVVECTHVEQVWPKSDDRTRHIGILAYGMSVDTRVFDYSSIENLRDGE